jgi:regulator of sigma E protease
MIISILQNFGAFVIVLSILVFVHEYGHYLGCKICGIKVDSFSIGMGKEICGWTDKNGVRWKISCLPFGGYLKMFGDEDISSSTANKELLNKMTEEEKKVSIHFQGPLKKFIVIFAGPFFNLLFAVILLTCVIKFRGIVKIEPIIADIIAESPAFEAGLMKNDIIIEINEKKINDFHEIMNIVAVNHLEPLKIKFSRDSKETIIESIQPKIIKSKDMFGNDIESPTLGIIASQKIIKNISLFKAFIEANKNIYKICKDTLIILRQMITGHRGVEGLGGPLKIAKYSAQSFSGGFFMVIYFMAMISANLGLMNLLPIPVLDGGQILFCLIEMLIRRPISEKIQESLLRFGFAILLLVMCFATFNDIKFFMNLN